MTLPRTRVPAPARPYDVALGPALDAVRGTVSGAGARLLDEVSVARTAGVLAELVRDLRRPLHELLDGLEAFRLAHPDRRLATVLARAWAEPGSAQEELLAFAAGCPGGDDEIARLGFGPKLWFTTNGVPVAWRPLPGPGAAGGRVGGDRPAAALAALCSAGLSPAEVADLTLADLGRLAPGAVFVPDLLADPLTVRHRPDGAAPRLAFVPAAGRIAVLSVVLPRYGPDGACRYPRERVLDVPRA